MQIVMDHKYSPHLFRLWIKLIPYQAAMGMKGRKTGQPTPFQGTLSAIPAVMMSVWS